MKNALKPNGIVCCQGKNKKNLSAFKKLSICLLKIKGENFWNFSDLVSKIVGFAGKIFPSVSYAQTQIPSYPTGI